MFNQNIQLLRYLSARLNVGNSSPTQKIYIRRKDKNKGYENMPFLMPKVTEISLDRRYNMAADELKVTFDNKNGLLSPDYTPIKDYTKVKGLPVSGYKDVILPYNEIYAELGYGDEVRRMFTGQLLGININENPPSISIDCKNNFRKLLKPIDPIDKKVLLYEEMDSFEIVKDLLERAGITSYVFDIETIKEQAFTVPKAEFELGTQYSDAIQQILDTMGHRLFADRFGTIQILKRELYSQKDFGVVDIDDYVNMTSGEYTIDPTVLRNRVIIQSNNGWQAFEDPFLRNYCNNEIISCGLEAPWAVTEEQKWAVADRFFLDMRRKLRRISIAIKGNPTLDIGDLVRVKALISTANAKYMIIAIQTSFSSSGYIDILDLEFVTDSKGHICEKAEGSYEDVSDSSSDNANIPITGTKRDAIVQYALSFRGTPYQWGGDSAHNKNHFGMDCSHFTYAVFKKFGLMNGYGRAKDQYPWCSSISEGELQPGDLVFYASSSNPRSIYHVAIYIGNGQAVSASGGDSSTNSLARAKAQKAFVKTHNFKYMRATYFYGKIKGL